ncbi:MAG: HD domain-containing protein, partial [Planctomycetota bacterium]
PSGLDEECLLFSKLIRDADKLDILYLVTGYYAQYRDEPESFKLEMELPNESGYSAAIVEAVLNGQRINYDKLETWNDMKLLQLSWVYDVNFAATLKRMRQRRLLEKVLDFLPDTEDIERVAKKISEYVDSRIEQEG